jgi:hypothetical protein
MVLVGLGWFGSVRVDLVSLGWIWLVWVGVGWFRLCGMVYVALDCVQLIWVNVGWFGLVCWVGLGSHLLSGSD